jgi:hypothetical protein
VSEAQYTELCLRRLCEFLGLPIDMVIDIHIDDDLMPPWAREEKISVVVPPYPVARTSFAASLVLCA